MTSCLNDTEYTYYDDAAITSFTLGTLNRYYTVEGSQGQDSVIKRTLSCADYAFSIDQNRGLVWNEDSLPIEIDASKVICTIGSKNGGSVVIKSMTSDTLTYYSSSDSIDFTSPRTFYVYGTSGLTYKEYTISVNVHKEVGDTCIWTYLGENEALGGLSGMKGVSDGENIYLFGSDGTNTRVYTTAVDDGRSWTEVATSPLLEPSASKSAIIQNGVLFTLSGGEVLRSSGAAVWETVGEADLKQLLGASAANLYALSRDGTALLSSPDGGATWSAEDLDDEASLLPSEDISFACRRMTTNAETDMIVLIGNRDLEDYPSDTTAVVWSKVDEYGAGARSNAWNYMPFAGDNYNNRAPRAANWQIVNYDENNIKALCGKGKGGSSAEALDRVYHSGDDGITWRNDTVMTLPGGLVSDAEAFAFVSDGKDSVWIICGGTGQVWKGRINRVAWKKEQDYFIE